MALSDELTKLAARAKEAEEHAAAAQSKAKADLEADVKNARASAQAQADSLHESADANRARISAWWHDVQRSWSQHVAALKEDMTDRRAEHDLDRANKRAENAEGDAAFAIDYAVRGDRGSRVRGARRVPSKDGGRRGRRGQRLTAGVLETGIASGLT